MATIVPIEDTMFWISFSVLSTLKRGTLPKATRLSRQRASICSRCRVGLDQGGY
jgi:hypothetical protein